MSVSTNSTFAQIHHETELLLDYSWQMRQWDLGIEECDKLLKTISKIEMRNNSDMVVHSISILKDKIKRCKSLFMFMNGTIDNSEAAISKTELISSYDTPRYTLYWCLSMVLENEHATAIEKKKQISDEIEIKLRYC